MLCGDVDVGKNLGMFHLTFRTCQADGQQLDMQFLAVCVV
jgi:hypothetical protein